MKQELKDTQKQLQDAQRKRKEVLEKQIRTAQTRVSARERKDETRRKIIIGALILHQIARGQSPSPSCSPIWMHLSSGLATASCSTCH